MTPKRFPDRDEIAAVRAEAEPLENGASLETKRRLAGRVMARRDMGKLVFLDLVDRSGRIQLLINTPLGKLTQQDDYLIRQAALQQRLPYTTTLSAASAACDAIIALRNRAHTVRSLQEWYQIARDAAE